MCSNSGGNDVLPALEQQLRGHRLPRKRKKSEKIAGGPRVTLHPFGLF